MQSTRHASLRVLGLAMIGCLLLPLVLLGSGAITIRREVHRAADERLVRTADILHEQALKVLQGTDVLLQNLLDMTHGVSDSAIRAEAGRWHDRLKAMSDLLPQLQSIWIVTADGRVSATDATMSDPALSARDDLAAEVRRDTGLFVGSVQPPLLSGGRPFFGVSRRRDGPAGGFGGVVTASLLPDDFVKFYREIGRMPGTLLVLMRNDGTLLARWPPIPPGAHPAAQPPILKAVAGTPDRGLLTAVSPIDGRERRLAWRRLDPYPVFVMAGLETDAIRGEWLGVLASHLVFGLPATALMLGALAIAMNRTRALFDEAERRAAAEAALQRSQRLEALGELTGGVAHDFNNLLMIVLGTVDRMRRQPREAADIRALDTIVGAVRRGDALTRQLLTFARRRALFPEAIDLARQLLSMRGLIAHSLRPDIALTIETDSAAPCVVKVDPAEFELAVLNLAVNARDAMPNGGRLTLQLRRVTLYGEQDVGGLIGDFIALSMSDTGVGIPPEALPRVFDPFFTTKDIGKGTGLGLSQVYGFARQSAGLASIASTPGIGTTVTLHLPACDETPAPGQTLAAPATAPGAGLRALLVEDRADVAGVTRSRLEMLGFEVTVAASGRTALAVLQRQTYALLLCDDLIPGGMSGIDLGHELQASGVQIPLILASSHADAAEQAQRAGCTVLHKPYDDHALREAVSDALCGRTAQPVGG